MPRAAGGAWAKGKATQERKGGRLQYRHYVTAVTLNLPGTQ
jgi:hypothetical protein